MLHHRTPSAVLRRPAPIPLALTGCAILLAFLTAPAYLAAASKTPVPCSSAIKPSDFVDKIDNPYFPLERGTTFIYEGTVDGLPARDVMQVTNNTKVILGVRTTEVNDRLTIDDKLVEATLDWYAQDKYGNVRYFGEDTKEFDEQGKVISTAGSWQAGTDDARPGIIMLAHPRVGDLYQQECAPGVAEDIAEVLSLTKKVKVSDGSFDHVLLTEETTPLAPRDVGRKYYAPGVGLILEVAVKGGKERFELVKVTSTENWPDPSSRLARAGRSRPGLVGAEVPTVAFGSLRSEIWLPIPEDRRR